MKQLREIIETLAADAERVIPSALAALGIEDFDEYVMGPSRQEKNKSLCVMIDPDASVSILENRLSVLFYLQLYRARYEDALSYVGCVLGYIRALDSAIIGMSYIENITADIFPMADNSHTLCYVSVSFAEALDDCD